MNKAWICCAALLMLTGCAESAQSSADANETETTVQTASLSTTAVSTAETTAEPVLYGDLTVVSAAKTTAETFANTTAETAASVTETTAETTAPEQGITVQLTTAAKSGRKMQYFPSYREAGEAFCAAYTAGDVDKLYTVCNLENYVQYKEAMGDSRSETEQQLRKRFGQFGDGFQLTLDEQSDEMDEAYSKQWITEQREKLNQFAQYAAQDGEAELAAFFVRLAAQAERFRAFMTVGASLVEDGTTEMRHIALIYTDEGWFVDCVLYEDEIEYESKSQKLRQQANANAKLACNAISSALVDLDSEDVRVDGFRNREFLWKGSDFADMDASKKPARTDDPEEQLKYKVWNYFQDIAFVDEIGWGTLRNSEVPVVAAVKKAGTVGVYSISGENRSQVYTDVQTAVSETVQRMQRNQVTIPRQTEAYYGT